MAKMTRNQIKERFINTLVNMNVNASLYEIKVRPLVGPIGRVIATSPIYVEFTAFYDTDTDDLFTRWHVDVSYEALQAGKAGTK